MVCIPEDHDRTVLLVLIDVDCMRLKMLLNGWAWEGLFIVLVQEVITEHVQSYTVAGTCYFLSNMVPMLNTNP